jgi:hypothetical protein
MLPKSGKKTGLKYSSEIMGAILCIVAFLLYWYGSYTFYPLEYHMLSLPIFIAGITLILFNFKNAPRDNIPNTFLAFLNAPAYCIYFYSRWYPSRLQHSSLLYNNKEFLPVTLSTDFGAPTLVLTTAAGQQTAFAVDVSCSGIYSLVAFTMFAAFLALITITSIQKNSCSSLVASLSLLY